MPESNQNEVKSNTWLKLVLFVGVVLLVLFGVRFLTQNRNALFNKQQPVQPTKTEEITYEKQKENIVESVQQGKSFQEARAVSPDLITNPNVAVSELSEEVKKANPKPKLLTINYDKGKFVPSELTINQGDLVMWNNKSQSEMLVVGEYWGTPVPVAPGKSFTQQFDFVGEYSYSDRYSTEDDPGEKGVVIVKTVGQN